MKNPLLRSSIKKFSENGSRKENDTAPGWKIMQDASASNLYSFGFYSTKI
jgi:hypothetical protein